MGEMRVLTQAGDIRLEWDPEDAQSVGKAKAEFDRLRADGYDIYEVTEVRGSRVERFPKKAAKLLAAPGVRKAADKKAGTRPKAMAGGPDVRTARLR